MRFKPQGKIIEMTKNPESFLMNLRFLPASLQVREINTNLWHHQNTKEYYLISKPFSMILQISQKFFNLFAK